MFLLNFFFSFLPIFFSLPWVAAFKASPIFCHVIVLVVHVEKTPTNLHRFVFVHKLFHITPTSQANKQSALQLWHLIFLYIKGEDSK